MLDFLKKGKRKKKNVMPPELFTRIKTGLKPDSQQRKIDNLTDFIHLSSNLDSKILSFLLLRTYLKSSFCCFLRYEISTLF